MLIAASRIREQLDKACVEFGITHGQYNVLRILRGINPDGDARNEISQRMIEKAPDVTRLVDRLGKSQLSVRFNLMLSIGTYSRLFMKYQIREPKNPKTPPASETTKIWRVF